MINGIFLLVSCVLLNLFNVASLTLRGNFIKRTFLEMPINLVRDATIIDTRFEPDLKLYFNTNKLEQNVNHYLISNLRNKTTSYKIAFTYFNYKPDGKLDFDIKNKPTNVQIRFNCVYFKNYSLDEHLVFNAKLI